MKETLYAPLSNVSVKINKNKEFKSFFSPDEVKCIMEYFFQERGKELFDGSSTRIDSISSNEDGSCIYLSPTITFFDFMTSNALFLNQDKIEAYLKERSNLELLGKFRSFTSYCSRLDTKEAILSTPYLSNLASVSVLIKDSNNKYGIVQRGKATIVASNYFGVSTTGCIENQDYGDNNPIINSVFRETKEELNVSLKQENTVISGVAFGKDKLQPIILCDASIEEPWEKIIEHIQDGVDYQKEVAHFYAVPAEKLGLVLKAGRMSEAARKHISLQVTDFDVDGTLDNYLLI